MQLVEQHVFKKTDARFAAIDAAAFASKHLYNKALYATRQAFFQDGTFPTYPTLYRQMKQEPEYAALPRKVAQWVLKQVCLAWESYRKALAAYAADPAPFMSPPRIPSYLDKQKGRNLLVYTTQALGQPGLRQGRILPSGLGIEVSTKQTGIAQVRIVPHVGYYVVEVVYERQEASPTGDPALAAAIDIGVDNLAAITSNKAGFIPRLVNGRPVKSTNQFYNKRCAALQEALGYPGITARLERLARLRTRRINHYLHTASKAIIALLVDEGIGTLVIGKNPGWKQAVELGRVNNQHFVQLPHARFIQMLTYKARLAGMRVVLQEESYTSKASFLDGDPLPVYSPQHAELPVFSGKRVQRGLYQAKDGRSLNADVNGSYNILRKALPDAFGFSLGLGCGKGIEAVVVRPVGLTFVWSVPPRARAAA